MRKGKNENLNLYSRGPALSGLNGEQGEHGRGHVVVVELLLPPLPSHHLNILMRNTDDLENVFIV